jgi:hypothetical protein
MHDDLRPRPHQYRNVRRGLLEAFAAVYADPRQACRAFAAVLEARGRLSALLWLRTEPERFGAPLADADARARDFADEAADSFALCRERCTRPLVRDGARLLRTVRAARNHEQRLKEAERHASKCKHDHADATRLRNQAEAHHARMMALARRVYAQPERAVEAVLSFGREHGRMAIFTTIREKWKPAGRLRRNVRKDWLGRWLGATETAEAESAFLDCRVLVADYGELLKDAPTTAEAEAARAAREVADAELGAIQAERAPVTDDPARTLRIAAQVFYDAMRLLERRPSDAVPHLSRQLAPLLPPDAHPLIAEVLKTAARYDDDRKPGGNDRERSTRRHGR